MKLIAHRGLTTGPDTNLENKPEQIKLALSQGFDCEIDVWFQDSQWYLGHDRPEYTINFEFLEQTGLWIHAKNLEALYVLGADTKLNFFWHQEDDYTLTSQGYIWTYPNKLLTPNSISVMPEWHHSDVSLYNPNCFGVCSDYVAKLVPKYIDLS
jgi:hypothetical protein